MPFWVIFPLNIPTLLGTESQRANTSFVQLSIILYFTSFLFSTFLGGRADVFLAEWQCHASWRDLEEKWNLKKSEKDRNDILSDFRETIKRGKWAQTKEWRNAENEKGRNARIARSCCSWHEYLSSRGRKAEKEEKVKKAKKKESRKRQKQETWKRMYCSILWFVVLVWFPPTLGCKKLPGLVANGKSDMVWGRQAA